MGTFIFQIQLNTGESGQRQTNQMRIGAALIVGVNFANGIFDPGAIHHHFSVCHFVPSLAKTAEKIVAIWPLKYN